MRHLAVIFATSLWFFSGCGQSALLMLDKDEKYHETLTHTQKKQLIDTQNATQALLRATYLNPIYPEQYQDRESFFVGIYIQDDHKGTSGGLNHPLYTLKLNGQPPMETTELEKNDALYKRMPLTERWSRYYLVSFNESNATKLELTLKKASGESLTFTYPRYQMVR